MLVANEKGANLLRVGTQRVDAGCLFGSFPRDRWESFTSPDRHNQVAFGNYCALLPVNGKWILIDAGPGDVSLPRPGATSTRGRSSLLRDIRDLSINIRDVEIVLLTHLYTEHAGGATHSTDAGRLLPTFPNARYIAQKAAWEEASRPNERNAHLYDPQHLEPLMETNQLDLVDGVVEIAPGVHVSPAPGPTNGHQIALMERDGTTFCFLGSLAPTLLHLNPIIVSASDKSPETTIVSKHETFERAIAESWQVAPIGYDGWLTPPEFKRLIINYNAPVVPKEEKVATPEIVPSMA